jgi:glutamate 5-kinase
VFGSREGQFVSSKNIRREVKSAKRIVIKVGSNLLAPGGELDRRFIGSLVRQINGLIQSGHQVLLVSSGSIAAGLKPLGLSKRPADLPMLQAAAAVGQGQLMHAYQVYFGRQQQTVAQVLITRDGLEDRQRYLNARNTVLTLLKKKVVPVINENDTVSVDEIRFGDNDRLSALVASFAEADLLIMLSNVPGLLDANQEVVNRVEKITPTIRGLVSASTSNEGVGGMSAKLEAARIGQKSGFQTVLAAGRETNVLARIVAGEQLGTWFVASQGRPAARKQWLAFSQKSHGSIIVDDGAAVALTKSQKSLLPIGVLGTDSSFKAGAGVSIINRRGREIARGITNYSSKDIDLIKGCKSRQLAAKVGDVRFDEVVHRDNLTVL